MAFDKLLQLVSNKRVAPPEVGRWIMDNGLSRLATNLGRATVNYDENMTSLCDDGRPISSEHRPRKRKLEDDHARIAHHFWYTVQDRSNAIDRQLDELVRTPNNTPRPPPPPQKKKHKNDPPQPQRPTKRKAESA